MQGSRNARSTEERRPPPRSLGATGNRTPGKAPTGKGASRSALSPCDGMAAALRRCAASGSHFGAPRGKMIVSARQRDFARISLHGKGPV
jgi:hypothetical protein